MTKLTIETDDNWTKEKIKFAINTEAHLLRKTADKIQNKISDFYGKVNDMELLEWEGEVETLQRVQGGR